MNSGEYIVISGRTFNNTLDIKDKTFYINSIGNNTYDSENYVVKISKKQMKSGLTLTDNYVYLGKRCLNVRDISGTTSQYYVHKHKTITDANDYLLDKVGFESPIWRDEKNYYMKITQVKIMF
jgi:predicted nucleic-acid-binding Zn-ribbon protein